MNLGGILEAKMKQFNFVVNTSAEENPGLFLLFHSYYCY